jgi:hypothetical protein
MAAAANQLIMMHSSFFPLYMTFLVKKKSNFFVGCGQYEQVIKISMFHNLVCFLNDWIKSVPAQSRIKIEQY